MENLNQNQVTETWEERIAREKMEKEKFTVSFRKKMADVAKLLNFKVCPRSKEEAYEPDVILQNGAEEFYISVAVPGSYRSDGKLYVSGKYPRFKDGQYVSIWDSGQAGQSHGPKVGISYDKSAEQIAKDIERRFLLEFRDHLAKVQASIKSRNEYEDNIAQNIALILGRKPTEEEAKSGNVSISAGEHWGSLRVSDDSVNFEIHSIKPETARALMELVRKLEAK